MEPIVAFQAFIEADAVVAAFRTAFAESGFDDLEVGITTVGYASRIIVDIPIISTSGTPTSWSQVMTFFTVLIWALNTAVIGIHMRTLRAIGEWVSKSNPF